MSTAGPSTSATTGPSSSDATEPESGSEASSNATSEGDTPPEITSLTINGNGTPMPVTSGSRLLLAAEATDDVGIDRIEFYDGRTLLGTADTPPYEASTVVTSANNGEHMYRAVAYDTAEQNDEAWLDVNVDIEGGSVVIMRDDVMEIAIVSIGGGGAPQLAVGPDGDVHLVTSQWVEAESVLRAAYRKFDAELNLIGSGHYPGTVDESTPNHVNGSPGALTQDGAYFVHTIDVLTGGEPLLVAFDTTTTTGQPGLTIGGSVGGVAVDDEGNLYAAIGDDEVRGIAPDFASSEWSIPLPNVPVHLVGGTDYVVADCRNGAELVVRKIFSGGAIEWERPVGSAPNSGSRPAVSVVDRQTETIATVFRDVAGDVRMQLRDEDGNSLDAFDLTDPVYVPHTMASDPQGAVLIGGAQVGSSTATVGELWLARHALDGAEIWSTDLDTDFKPVNLWISSVAIGPDGAAYVTGTRDVVVGKLVIATLWIARVEL